MKIELGPLKIDPIELGSQGNAILGIRDSGKSYTATYLAERLFEADIPFIAFDPIGIWRFLRVPARGGRGYPVVVAGGKEGDLPLTETGAPEIVRAAMRNGVSLVIDLFDIKLSKSAWRRIVTQCVRVLLHENQQHGLRHVFIEEAAEFIPQRPSDWDVYNEIEKLARMGGNSRLGYTLINQRSQEVSKAILELCENIFLHRQRGKNALENLEKWLSVAGAEEKKAIMASLPDLPQGDCWAWIGGDKPRPPTLVHIPTKNSLHPDRRVMRGDIAKKPRNAVDVGEFVAGMKSTLVAVEEEDKANNPVLLRKRIAELEAAAKKAAPAQVAVPDKSVLQAAEQRGFKRGFAEASRQGTVAFNALRDLTRATVKGFASSFDGNIASEKISFNVSADMPPSGSPASGKSAPAPTRAPVHAPPAPRKPLPAASGNGTLPKGERLCLVAIAQRGEAGITRQHLTVITGYKRSTRDAYLQRLREKSMIDNDRGDRIVVTDIGADALGSYDPLPTGEALQQHVLSQLPEGERAVLAVLIPSYPQGVDRDAISEATGYKRSTRDAYIQRLSTRELINTDHGTVTASEDLFA